MLKKLGAICSLIIMLVGVMLNNSQPVFLDYADSYEVYLRQASSLAEIRRVSKNEYFLLSGIKGESVTVDVDSFDLDKLLKDFDAEIKICETPADLQIYYAYSPKLKRVKEVGGEKINLQIVLSLERVVLGCPLVFGSF